MSKVGRIIGILAGCFILVALTYFAAPRIAGWVQAYLIKHSAAQAVPQEDTAKTVGMLLTALKTAVQYNISGTKRVTGGSTPYTMDFSCSVNGADYAVQTEINGHKIRQVFTAGKYTLVDDTAKKAYKDLLYIDIPDKYMQEALTGRLVRSRGEILNGNHVNCAELYKDGRVYMFYVNQQGALVRYYYIYEGNEVTIDFTKAATDGAADISFDIPADYTAGEINELKKIESGEEPAEPDGVQQTVPGDAAQTAP